MRDGVKAVKGAPGTPGAVVQLHCREPLSNGKECGLVAVERKPPYRCSSHLYLAEYPDCSDEARARAKRPRAMPLQRETLF